jgi:hypothetical protein
LKTLKRLFLMSLVSQHVCVIPYNAVGILICLSLILCSRG